MNAPGKKKYVKAADKERERKILSPLLSSKVRVPSAEGKTREALTSRKTIQSIERAFVAMLNPAYSGSFCGSST